MKTDLHTLPHWVISNSVVRPTDDSRRMVWRIRKFALDGNDAPELLVRDSDSRGPSRSFIGRAFNHLASLIGLAAWFAGIFAVTYIIGALMEPIETPEPDCRHQYNRAAEYVRHCYFHDGRGYVEVQP